MDPFEMAVSNQPCRLSEEALDAAIYELRKSGLSLRETGRRLGVAGNTVSRRMDRINSTLPEADRIAANVRTRTTKECTWSDAQLIAAVSEANSVRDVISLLGLSVRAAGNWKTVRRAIDRLELSTEHWDRRKSQPGPTRSLEEVMVEGSDYPTHALRLRLLSSGMKEHRCESCERTEWLDQPIALELEHINGVSNDHRFENLKMLCPNCHAQTSTWRGRKNRIHRCADCGVGISGKATRCQPCFNATGRGAPAPKVEWPDVDAVRELVRAHGWSGAGRALGVSDNAVRKHLRRAERLAATVDAA